MAEQDQTQEQPQRDPNVPAEGCVFMYQGEDRAEVNVESGSVEIMEQLGWSKDKPKKAAK